MTPAPSRDEILALLDEVKDPEIPVLSVVELGVVRDAIVDGDGVTVVITPTYSGCPAMKVIEEEIVAALRRHGIEPVRVRTVHAPAWTTDWIPESAKRKLEAYGIAAPGAAAREEELVTIRSRGVAIRCPRCGSSRTRVESGFGSTACKSLCVCEECREPFELFKAI